MLLLQTGSRVSLTQLHHVDSLLQRFIISLGDAQRKVTEAAHAATGTPGRRVCISCRDYSRIRMTVDAGECFMVYSSCVSQRTR